MSTVNRSSPTKRRTRAEVDAIKAAMLAVIEAEQPMTVRQVFYRMTTTKLIGKTEAEYKGTVCRLLTELRRDGSLPYDWIADNTRWMRKPNTYTGLADLLDQTARLYRRSVWNEQGVYVEVWLEKDALSGVVYDVTDEWDVPLMVTRGYPSLSYLHAAGDAIADVNKPAFIYYFGDLDPSGVDIPRKVEAGLREYAPDAEIHFERCAVTREQVDRWSLPTRPTKTTDTRSKGFDGESVELDAIAPDDLRGLVRERIERHVNWRALDSLRVAEASEREYLTRLSKATP